MEHINQISEAKSRNNKVIKDYTIDLSAMLGEGAYGKVYKAYHNHTNMLVACKIVPTKRLNEDEKRLLDNELQMMEGKTHLNLVC